MNIEYFTMSDESQAAINKAIEQTLASEDGSNDATNDGSNQDDTTFNENAVCIQELDEVNEEPDKKRVALYEKWIPFFINDGIALNDGKLVCTICRKQVSADKKSRLSEHISSKKHKKMMNIEPEERPTDFEPFTPNTKRIKLANGISSSSKAYSKIEGSSKSGRDKSHEILLADTLNLFVQLDVPFEKLNSEVWQSFVKKHVKNGDLILKNFTFYKTDS